VAVPRFPFESSQGELKKPAATALLWGGRRLGSVPRRAMRTDDLVCRVPARSALSVDVARSIGRLPLFREEPRPLGDKGMNAQEGAEEHEVEVVGSAEGPRLLALLAQEHDAGPALPF
jgi:hypothetical protein